MKQSVVDGDASLRINDQHARQQIPGLARLQPVVLRGVGGKQDVGEEPLEGVARVARPVLHVVPHRRLEPVHELGRGRAQLLYNLVPLVYVVGAREQHATPDHLAHDAAHGPYVDVLLVAHAQYDLGRPVVPRDDVGGHHEGGAGRPGQAKVEDLEGAVALDDDVAGLEVPVDYARRVEVLYAAEHLVEQVRHALVVQVHLYHLAEVGVHELHHQVDVLELLEGPLGGEGVQEADYVLVVDQLHELELAVGPLGVGDVLEGPRELLYRDVLRRDGVVGGAAKRII